MMQLGNLAIVAANHKDCMLQIYDNEVTVHTGQGTERKSISCLLYTSNKNKVTGGEGTNGT